MKKLSKIVLVLVFSLLILTGCSEETKFESGTTVDKNSDTTNATGTLLCSRGGKGLGDSTAELSYEVNYKKGYLTKVHSIEKVISEDSSILDQYEDAYKNIFKVYKDLKYYENTITRVDNSVTSDTTIDYSKIDMKKLEELESSSQSIIKNGKVSLNDWLTFASKVGTKCIEK
ncbi:MAG: hypothetical protein Q4E69_04980 [Bacilli bacterium]|nr:hypothetical protein [Bacilli bacterium]